MDREQLRNRAIEASRILENEVFKEALEKLEEEYTRVAINSDDPEEREEARKNIHLIRALAGHIQGVIRDWQFVNGENQ